MSDPTFGISITRVDDEPRPAVAADLSVIGLVVTAPDANPAKYPLNTPVLIFSDDTAAVVALGASGTAAAQIELINAQLGEFQVAAKIVIVRVEQGANDDETITNLIGNSGLKTGIWALTMAGPLLGIVPRLIGVPSHTHQRKKGVVSVAIGGAGGTGYTVNQAITASGGTGTGFAGRVASVDGDGSILTVEITNPGTYTVAPTLAVTGGTGATLTAAIDDLANGLCAALPPVLAKLLGHAVVSGPHSTYLDYVDWRETLNSDRLIPVETWAKVGVSATVIDSVGSVLGVAVRRDHEKEGRPFHSWANQPIYGIVGPNRPIDFSLADGATEGQMILAQNGGVILRGEAGVETAIASGGFVFVGTDNAGEDDIWRFYNVTRGRDYIHLLFMRTLRFYLGKFNLTGQTIEAVRNTMTIALRNLQADGCILGFKVSFTRASNDPSNLRQGRFKIDFRAEEAPVLRYLGINSGRYLPALDALLDDILTGLEQAA